MYIHDLPSTGAVSFADFLITTDLVSQVAQTTELRARLRTVLKEHRAAPSSSTLSSSSGPTSSNSNAASSSSSNSPSSSSSPDWLKLVKAVDEYLPSLLGVFNSVQTDDLILRYEPVFSWRTVVSRTSTLRQNPRIELAGLYYELCSVIFLSGILLSNFANTVASNLGPFERDTKLDTETRNQKNDRLRWAADTLCKASGVFLYLSQELIPKWENLVGRIEGRPPDLTKEVCLALSKCAFAQAESLAIRKLLSPAISLAADTITPGPPLPKNHPSPSLLAKLHLQVAEDFGSAWNLAKTVGKKSSSAAGGSSNFVPSSSVAYRTTSREDDLVRRTSNLNVSGAQATGGGDDGDYRGGAAIGNDTKSKNDKSSGGKKLFGKLKNMASSKPSNSGPHDALGNGFSSLSPGGGLEKGLELDSGFLKYLQVSTTYHTALAYKWLGVDAGENSRIGESITFLRMSQSQLNSLSSGGGKDNFNFISSSSSSSSSWKNLRDQELSSIAHFLGSYTKLNDTVTFQPVPSVGDLQSKVPTGRSALQVKPYTLPPPSFGPGSKGYVSRHGDDTLDAQNFHLLPRDHPAKDTLVVHKSNHGDGGGEDSNNHDTNYAGQGAYY